MRLIHVAGARPNFMKLAPVLSAIGSRSACSQVLIHTGQHYDKEMSEVFFKQLGLPEPDVNLGVGPGTHGHQTGQMLGRLEDEFIARRPDLVLVYGDVNSTVAATLAATKLGIRVGHVEAGLRSFDRSMPEEINRLVTDQLSDVLFTPSTDGDRNLAREGVDATKVHMVGNVMIDTLVRLLPKARGLSILDDLGLQDKQFGLVTLHRPSNVDSPEVLRDLWDALTDMSERLPLLFPIHPRTRSRLGTGSPNGSARLRLTKPVGYLEFLALQASAAVVITDSGGIQEETTFLRVPCLTVRENTERPITVEMGTNQLVGQSMSRLRDAFDAVLDSSGSATEIPPLWDGRSGRRIAEIIDGLG